MGKRQIALDTETTGVSVADGHRIIEVACVEIVDRRVSGNLFCERVNPGRAIDAGAQAVHGISVEDLRSKPPFGQIAEALISFIGDAEVIIHNATFDLGFLEYELAFCGRPGHFSQDHAVIDSLQLARRLHPGQANSLTALCRRYSIDDSKRSRHGALVDATLLARVYLAMTGGQPALDLEQTSTASKVQQTPFQKLLQEMAGRPLRVIAASSEETEHHHDRMHMIHKAHLKALRAKINELAERLRQGQAEREQEPPPKKYKISDAELAALPELLQQAEQTLRQAESRGPILF